MTITKKQHKVFEQHLDCPAHLRRNGLHVGLYCARHGVWIKWLSREDQQNIQDLVVHAK